MLPPDDEDYKELAAEAVEVTGLLPNSIAAEEAGSKERDGIGEQLSTSSITSSSDTSSSNVKCEPAAAEAGYPSALPPVESRADEPESSQASADDGARLVQAEVHASLENGEKEPSGSSPSSSEEKESDFERRDEEEDDDGSRKDDCSEGDLVDISAYSGIGEDDSGGSQLDDEDEDEEEEEEEYQPETSCSEMPGLPEEEEPPPANRKIKFSTDPIKVS